MDTDFTALEMRYGTALATTLQDEIKRAEQHRFNFYPTAESLKRLRRIRDELEVEGLEAPIRKVA